MNRSRRPRKPEAPSEGDRPGPLNLVGRPSPSASEGVSPAPSLALGPVPAGDPIALTSRFGLPGACLGVLLLFATVATADEPATFGGPAQGTTYRVRLGRPADTPDLHAAVEAELAAIDRVLSTYRDDSDLTRFNRSASLDWVAVPPDLAAVVRAAADVHRRSGGAFDVTIGPLVERWGFGRKRGPFRVPSDEEIDAARQAVGMSLLDVRADPPALRKRAAGLRVDLNGIAPGFTVDRVAALLERRAVTDYLVELGGEIRVRGVGPTGRPWRVGVERPGPPGGVMLTIEPGAGAVSTSGDYRRRVEHEGKRYSHLIDPRASRPVAHAATAVTVVADDCTSADAWATALMVLGPADGPRVADAQGIAAYFVVRDAGEVTRDIPTAAFARRFPGAAVTKPFPNEPASVSWLWAGAGGLLILGFAAWASRRDKPGGAGPASRPPG